MKLKKVISGLLASVMVFSSVVSGIPATVMAAATEESSGGDASTGTELGTDGKGWHEVTAGKKVMVSQSRGTTKNAADILGAEPVYDRYWMGEQLRPNTFDNNTGSEDYMPSQWLIIDLGYTETEFQSISLSYQKKGWPTKGRIETGDDTVNWRTVTTISREQPPNTPEGNAIEVGTATYTPDNEIGKLDRFVRFYFEEVNGLATGFKTVAVQSVKIMGRHTGKKVDSVKADHIWISEDGMEVTDKCQFDLAKAEKSLPKQFKIKMEPSNSSRKLIKWSTSNSVVATVEGNSTKATVTPHKVGKAYITATLAANESISHTMEVNVVDGDKTNVAAGKPATASEDNGKDGAENVTDGYADEWHTWYVSENRQEPISESSPVTLTVDLGRNGTTFDEVRISYFRAGGYGGSASKYILQTSTTGDGDWFDVVEIEKTNKVEGHTVDVLTPNGLTVTNRNGTPQETVKMSSQALVDYRFRRYLRVKFTGPRLSGEKNSLGVMELAVVGTQSNEIPGPPVKVTGFTLDKPADSSISLSGKGATEQIKTSVAPKNATNPYMTWTSSDPEVATVDKDGNVTAAGRAGDATITFFPASNSKLTQKTVNVTVEIPQIKLNANGGAFQGESPNEISVGTYVGRKIMEPESPKKDNATFLGWFDAAEDGNEITFDAQGMSGAISETVSMLYAHWDDGATQPVEETITFDAKGGYFGNDQSVTTKSVVLNKDKRVSRPEDPKQDGYAFVAWYMAKKTESVADEGIETADLGEEVRFDENGLSESTFKDKDTLEAHWIKRDEDKNNNNKVVVTFHANEGRFPLDDVDPDGEIDKKEQLDVVADDQKNVAEPKKPERDGYTFTGWFTTKNGNTEKEFDENGIASFDASTTLYAGWQENPNIKLTPDKSINMEKGATREITAKIVPADAQITWSVLDATGKTASDIVTVEQTSSNNGTVKATVTAAKAGTAKVKAEATVTVGEKTEVIKATVDVTVTPVRVTFDADEGLFPGNTKTRIVDADDAGKVSMPEETPAREGYEFDAWYQQRDIKKPITFGEDGKSTTAFSPEQPTENTLYAHWKKIITVEPESLNLTMESGEQTLTAQDVQAGKVLEWSVDSAGVVTVQKGENNTAKVTVAGAGKTVITASHQDVVSVEIPVKVWEGAIPEITFDANGGTFGESGNSIKQTVDANEKVTAPADPSHAELQFDGWYDAAEDGNKVDLSTATFTESKTLYAHWKEKPTEITITFDPNGGTLAEGTASSVTIPTGGKVTAPEEPSNGDMTFDGWYDAAEGGNEVDLSTATFTETQTLYAHWSKKEITITFNPNGGTLAEGTVSPVTILSGGKVTAPANPINGDMTFDGWYDAAEGGNKVDLSTATFTESKTLYAHWSEKEENPNPSVTITLNPSADFSMEKDATKQIEATVSPAGTNVTWKAEPAGYVTVAADAQNSAKATITAIQKTTEAVTITATAGTASASVKVTVTEAQGGGDDDQKKVEVTFDANEGTFGESGSVFKAEANAEHKVTAPANPTRDGWEFDAWYDAAEGGNKIDVAAATFTESKTLYAHWTKKNESQDPEITITLNPGEPFSMTAGGETKEITAAVSVAGTAVAWKAEPEGIVTVAPAEGDTTKATITAVKAGEATITATAGTASASVKVTVTEAQGGEGDQNPAEVKVTFHANEGTFADAALTKEVKAGAGGIVNRPADPVREGYTFAGWYDAAAGGNLVAFDANGAATFTASATLYAHWTQNTIIPPVSGNEFKDGAEETVKGIVYRVISASKKTAMVKKGTNKKKVTIPATVKIKGQKCKVVQIGSKAFKGKKKLQTIIIGKNVKTINKNAFQNCTKLKAITLKGTALKTVKKGAFKKTSKKLTVKIPAKIKKSKAKRTKLMRALKKGGNKNIKYK